MFDLKIIEKYYSPFPCKMILLCQMTNATQSEYDLHPRTISLFGVIYTKTRWENESKEVVYSVEITC